MAPSRSATSSGSTSRMPRGGEESSLGGSARANLVLRDGHDDLRLAARIQEGVVVPDDGSDDRRVGGVLDLEGAEAGDATLEARVDRLQAEARRPLEYHREQAFA